MRALLPPITLATYRYWAGSRVHLDQTGDSCVANALTHLVCDSPRSHRLSDVDSDAPGWVGKWDARYRSPQSGEVGFRGYLYDQAQQLDEFTDTPPSGGTSVRAGAKALQSLGAITAYHWAQSISDITKAILTTGPVVVGTEWTEDMFSPVGSNYVIKPTGPVVGGHAYKLDGINITTGYVRLKNSWSASWGQNSYAHIHRDDLDELVFGRDGEAVIAVEA